MDEVLLPLGIPPWRGSMHDTLSLNYAEAVEVFFERAVRPTCNALNEAIGNTPERGDDPTMDRWENLRLAQLEAHKSFALSLNGLWERNFRQHLWHSAAVIGWREEQLERVEKAEWEVVFEEVRGFALSKFSSFAQLQLLHRVGNAVRHGNGPSTRALFRDHPGLFLEHEVTTGWFSYFAHGAEPASSIRRLWITLDQLETFKRAIVEGWMTIRTLQLSAAR